MGHFLSCDITRNMKLSLKSKTLPYDYNYLNDFETVLLCLCSYKLTLCDFLSLLVPTSDSSNVSTPQTKNKDKKPLPTIPTYRKGDIAVMGFSLPRY